MLSYMCVCVRTYIIIYLCVCVWSIVGLRYDDVCRCSIYIYFSVLSIFSGIFLPWKKNGHKLCLDYQSNLFRVGLWRRPALTDLAHFRTAGTFSGETNGNSVSTDEFPVPRFAKHHDAMDTWKSRITGYPKWSANVWLPWFLASSLAHLPPMIAHEFFDDVPKLRVFRPENILIFSQ